MIFRCFGLAGQLFAGRLSGCFGLIPLFCAAVLREVRWLARFLGFGLPSCSCSLWNEWARSRRLWSSIELIVVVSTSQEQLSWQRIHILGLWAISLRCSTFCFWIATLSVWFFFSRFYLAGSSLSHQVLSCSQRVVSYLVGSSLSHQGLDLLFGFYFVDGLAGKSLSQVFLPPSLLLHDEICLQIFVQRYFAEHPASREFRIPRFASRSVGAWTFDEIAFSFPASWSCDWKRTWPWSEDTSRE